MVVILILLAIGLGGVALASETAAPVALVEAIDASTLDTSKAVDVGGLVLDTGLIEMRIHNGTLFPATPVEGRVRELVFLGQATVEVEPPDEIEADQLEFYTGSPRVTEPVSEAVLVICRDDAVEALFRGRSAAAPDASAVERASSVFADWRAGTLREVAGARSGMLLDALGDPSYEGYFAGQFEGERLGRFLVLVDPDAQEQVSVGRFVPLELSTAEEREVRRLLRREQRRDRLIGLSVDELGTFDTWMMASLRDATGNVVPGTPAFAATHYEMDVTIDRGGERISGKADIAIRAIGPARRIVRLTMDSDLRLTAIKDERGDDVPFIQELGTAYAVLPETPSDAPTRLHVEFQGAMIAKVEGSLFALVNTQNWYPHIGSQERATYDVTFHWPEHYDLVAAGRRVDGASKGYDYWERRKIDVPVGFFSFEVGRYDFREATVGNIHVRFAFDRRTDSLSHLQEQIVETTRDVLEYYQEVFGPYPLDELTIVTAPRSFGQGLLSFVSFPSFLMIDIRETYLTRLLGFTDRRMIVAHELAHQWWGNMLGWSSYRDQWLSEAMATHAAARWAAHLPEHLRPHKGRLATWQLDLSAEAAGRPTEAIGPLVLGDRLDSSKASAREPIVYRKGAVVLGMLEQVLGQDVFFQTQKTILQVANYRDISTETYLEALERLTGIDLDWFAERYVYGTGIPRVFYRYDVRGADDGAWRVELVARMVPSYHFSYHVEQLEDGRFDVRRTVDARDEPERAALAVPFQVAVLRNDVEKNLMKKKNMRRADGELYNAIVDGRLFLQGETTRIEIPIDYEPVTFWLDREGEVLGNFLREDRVPWLVSLEEAYAAEAAGDVQGALDVLERLASASDTDSSHDEDDARWSATLGIETELYRARLAMDLARLPLARECAERAGEQGGYRGFGSGLENVSGRLDILSGNYRKAFKRYRQDLANAPWRLNQESLLLLAIAAKQLDEGEVLDRALEVAVERGADPGPLAGDTH